MSAHVDVHVDDGPVPLLEPVEVIELLVAVARPHRTASVRAS